MPRYLLAAAACGLRIGTVVAQWPAGGLAQLVLGASRANTYALIGARKIPQPL
jgi:hypothetical protein